MADIKFLETMSRKEKRAVANSLRGVGKCLNCDFLGRCYNKQQLALKEQKEHNSRQMLPKWARNLPTEVCEYHDGRHERGEFYPKYSN